MFQTNIALLQGYFFGHPASASDWRMPRLQQEKRLMPDFPQQFGWF